MNLKLNESEVNESEHTVRKHEIMPTDPLNGYVWPWDDLWGWGNVPELMYMSRPFILYLQNSRV